MFTPLNSESSLGDFIFFLNDQHHPALPPTTPACDTRACRAWRLNKPSIIAPRPTGPAEQGFKPWRSGVGLLQRAAGRLQGGRHIRQQPPGVVIKGGGKRPLDLPESRATARATTTLRARLPSITRSRAPVLDPRAASSLHRKLPDLTDRDGRASFPPSNNPSIRRCGSSPLSQPPQPCRRFSPRPTRTR